MTVLRTLDFYLEEDEDKEEVLANVKKRIGRDAGIYECGGVYH